MAYCGFRALRFCGHDPVEFLYEDGRVTDETASEIMGGTHDRGNPGLQGVYQTDRAFADFVQRVHDLCLSLNEHSIFELELTSGSPADWPEDVLPLLTEREENPEYYRDHHFIASSAIRHALFLLREGCAEDALRHLELNVQNIDRMGPRWGQPHPVGIDLSEVITIAIATPESDARISAEERHRGMMARLRGDSRDSCPWTGGLCAKWWLEGWDGTALTDVEPQGE
jgi:ribosome modulation factor